MPTPEPIRFPLPQGPRLEGFGVALDPRAVASILEPALGPDVSDLSVVPYYIRHKGSHGTLVGHRVHWRDTTGARESFVSVRVASPPRLRSEAERFEQDGRPALWGHPGFVLREDLGILILGFPLDRALRGVARWLDRRKVRRFLREQDCLGLPAHRRIRRGGSLRTLLRFRPERRVVVRWDFRIRDEETGTEHDAGVVIRLHSRDAAVAPPDLHLILARAAVPVPRTLCAINDLVRIDEALPGSPAGRPRDVVADAGAILARLHEIPAPAGMPRVADAVSELARAQKAGVEIAGIAPDLLPQLDQLIARLESTKPGPEPHVLLHGDLHPGQFLIEDDRIALMDLDRAGRGPAAYDLASWSAHLALLDPESARLADLGEAYQSAGGKLPDSLPWYRVSSLVRIALMPFRRADPSWPQKTEALVELAIRGAREL